MELVTYLRSYFVS